MAYNSKTYRKFIATAATATLVAGAIAPMVSAASFDDVAPKYQDAVDFVAQKGIQGFGDSFGTYQNIKRVDAAVMVAKVLGLDTENAKDAGFTDVPARAIGAVNALKEAGITSGKTETTFDSNSQITRGELAIWIQRGFELQASGDMQFKDVNKNYEEAVKALVANGITNGVSETEFGTTQPAKRGDFAIFLYRAANSEAAQVTEVSELDNIVVNEGVESANLPTEVEVTLSNGEKAQKAVEWDTTDLNLDKAGEYTVTGDVEGTDLDASVKVEVKAVNPEVISVKSMNATQVEVKFNKAIDAESLFVEDNEGAFNEDTVSLTSLDNVSAGDLTGELSKDGKTLTVTTENPLEKRYDVVIENVETKDGKDVVKYSEMINIAKDTTAPTILGTERITASKVKVNFSEPMKAFDSVTFKYADGTSVTGVSGEIEAGADEAVFEMTDDVKADKDIVATFIGAQDQAGNLITPNPAKVTFTKGEADGVAPTVEKIKQTGVKTFTIQFSEELVANPTVKINGDAAVEVEQDEDDATVYNVTAENALEGAATIAVKDFADLSGEAGTDMTKVVTFEKDTDAPEVVSSSVVVDEDDRKEYLEITFDKDVVLSNAEIDVTDGSHEKDYVTTTIADEDITATDVEYKSESNKKVIRVALDSLLGDEDVKDAAYQLDLAFTGVESEAGVAVEDMEASFTRGEDGIAANTAVVAITNVDQAADDNNKIEVTFDKAVDGSSATDVDNYEIDGAIVESVTLKPVVDGSQIAVLNLEAGSNEFTGTRNINIKNVKALGSSKTMEPYFTNDVSLNENVAPTIEGAKLIGLNQVEITFSEAIALDAEANDFQLLIDGEVADNAITTPEISEETTKVIVTLADDVTAEDLEDGLSIKVLDTIDLADAAGNIVSGSTITVSR